MKKTLIMLGLLAVSFTAVLAMPDDGTSGVPRVMYSSTIHYDSGDALVGDEAVQPSVKIASVVNKVEKVERVAVVEKATETEEEVAVAVETVAVAPVAVAEVEEDVCGFGNIGDAEHVYSAQVVTVRKKFRYDASEEFRVKVYVKNTGNMPWFSLESECIGARVHLATMREDYHASVFYAPEIDEPDNGWVSANKVRLDAGQMRIDPGEVASFTFWGKATDSPTVYREYFAPVVADVRIMDEAEFKVDIYSGETGETAAELRTKLLYAYKSMEVNDMKIDGERSVDIDLSEQKLQLKIDDYVVREFMISSGKSSTPTPTGTFRIMLKNEVRVGHEAPHYIMPRFQMFTAQGAGLHALPSLGTDGGVFWTEARDHIGRPASHGCVRMLPEDADFAFGFTEVGDAINIHW